MSEMSKWVQFAAEDGLVVFSGGLVGFVVLYRTLDFLRTSRLIIKQDFSSDKKTYGVILPLARAISNAIGFSVMLPALPYLFAYLLSDELHIYLPDRSYGTRLQFGTSVTIGSIMFDMCARPNIHWVKMVHHILSALIAVAAGEWAAGVEIGIFHILASVLEVPFNYTFFVIGTNDGTVAGHRRCAWWLNIARYWIGVVKSLAQVAIVMILIRGYRYQVQANGFQLNALLALVVVLALDAVIALTQVYTVYALSSMRRRHLAKVKEMVIANPTAKSV